MAPQSCIPDLTTARMVPVVEVRYLTFGGQVALNLRKIKLGREIVSVGDRILKGVKHRNRYGKRITIIISMTEDGRIWRGQGWELTLIGREGGKFGRKGVK